jgi:HTH-type transcriptional regulator/antitoxin HigA
VAQGVRSPGDFIREELKSRGWTQDDLARILGRPIGRVNEIIQGKQAVSVDVALALSAAFGGTTPETWLARESAYRLSLAEEAGSEVRRRARLYDLAPVKDMEKRGWIRHTSTADELEAELRRFFGQDDLSTALSLAVATRRSDPEELTPAQRAWCFRARALAAEQLVPPFDPYALADCADALRKLAAFAPEARKIPRVLNSYGIRYVVVEPLPGTKIDGAALWIDEHKPVIVLSLRYDRIDALWFTLCHEFIHIKHRDGLSVDTALVGEDAIPSAAKPAIERRADTEGAGLLVPADKLQSFIRRVAPLYSRDRIIQFAHRIKIHPGVIVGQLQNRGEVGYHANRELLAKVRETATSVGIVDGWGHTAA